MPKYRDVPYSDMAPSPLKKQCLQPSSLAISIPSFKACADGKENEPHPMEVEESSGDHLKQARGGGGLGTGQLWRPFLEKGFEEMPETLYFTEVFSSRVLQQLVSLHGDKKDSFKKHAEAMIKYNQDGKLRVQYEQKSFKRYDPEGTFQGSYRIGRYYSKYPNVQNLFATP